MFPPKQKFLSFMCKKSITSVHIVKSDRCFRVLLCLSLTYCSVDVLTCLIVLFETRAQHLC